MSASRIRRKATTEESQDRMYQQRVKELERRGGLSLEELIKRANQKGEEKK